MQFLFAVLIIYVLGYSLYTSYLAWFNPAKFIAHLRQRNRWLSFSPDLREIFDDIAGSSFSLWSYRLVSLLFAPVFFFLLLSFSWGLLSEIIRRMTP